MRQKMVFNTLQRKSESNNKTIHKQTCYIQAACFCFLHFVRDHDDLPSKNTGKKLMKNCISFSISFSIYVC